jgi:hypothetical protein
VVYSVVYRLYHNPPDVVNIHLLYIDTLQQVDCDIMCIPQNTPQITIHLLYIDTLQQVDCTVVYRLYHNPPDVVNINYIFQKYYPMG